jgi:hypothetical protein
MTGQGRAKQGKGFKLGAWRGRAGKEQRRRAGGGAGTVRQVKAHHSKGARGRRGQSQAK